MKIRRKVVQQLLLTHEEVQLLMGMLDQAQRGTTVHSAETKMASGGYFNITIDEHANDPDWLHDAVNKAKK